MTKFKKRLLYIGVVLSILLWSIVATRGWYTSAHKKCPDAETIVLRDTIYKYPLPTAVISPKDTVAGPNKTKVGKYIAKILGKENKHKVKSGENLYRIGLKYGMTAEQLRILNNLPDYNIEAGQWIYLGTIEERLATAPKVDSVYTYEQTFGDSTNITGTVTTQSYGPIESMMVHYELMGSLKPRNKFYVGGGADFDRNLYVGGAYATKDGWLFTGNASLTEKRYMIGVAKELRFKK
jgi:hypothetical protein